jgi:hypothetical protein
MSEQAPIDRLPLFANARTTDPETSHEAAASVDLRPAQEFVLTLLAAYGPCHDERLVQKANGRYTPSGIRSRRAELEAAKLVKFTGSFTKTDAGRKTRVWEVTPLGRRALKNVLAPVEPEA